MSAALIVKGRVMLAPAIDQDRVVRTGALWSPMLGAKFFVRTNFYS